MRKVYQETKLRFGCYVFQLEIRWIKEAWKQETRVAQLKMK